MLKFILSHSHPFISTHFQFDSSFEMTYMKHFTFFHVVKDCNIPIISEFAPSITQQQVQGTSNGVVINFLRSMQCAFTKVRDEANIPSAIVKANFKLGPRRHFHHITLTSSKNIQLVFVKALKGRNSHEMLPHERNKKGIKT